jgi:hypothetical protein
MVQAEGTKKGLRRGGALEWVDGDEEELSKPFIVGIRR